MKLFNESNKFSVRKMCFTAILIALSVILSNVTIFSTISFDSMPAFIGGILISPVIGGIIGLIGHLATSLLKGFPFTIPIHILIGFEMFVVVYITSIIYKRRKVLLAGITGILLNGIVSTLITGFFMKIFLGGTTPIGLLSLMGLPLTLASFVNIVLAFIIAKGVRNANIQI
ncbi:ECF transporter S component [Clostridium sp.]|uniref:ECF transporter S component n=1 Tax=Clostridium sp. TaxID=1506 RepID=UPI002637AAEA|nr:ECF transporter S component [Clostridium sp.]